MHYNPLNIKTKIFKFFLLQPTSLDLLNSQVQKIRWFFYIEDDDGV